MAFEQTYPNPVTVGLWDATRSDAHKLGGIRPSVDGCHRVQKEKEILLWSVWKPCSISDWKVLLK